MVACIVGALCVVAISSWSPSNSLGLAPVLSRTTLQIRPSTAGRNTRVSARANSHWMEKLGAGAAAFGLAGAMSMGTPMPAVASEYDVLDASGPTTGYIMDDAPCLQKGSEKKMNDILSYLDVGKGYKLDVVTVRKLEESPDADTLASKMLDKWSNKDKSNSAVLVLVVKNSEVGLAAGDNFVKALGEDKAASIAQETVGYFANQGRPNQGVSEGVKRINAILTGDTDPGAPEIKEYRKERTYKTKEETDVARGASYQVVGALLLIAFVVPMLQYAGYVQKD